MVHVKRMMKRGKHEGGIPKVDGYTLRFDARYH